MKSNLISINATPNITSKFLDWHWNISLVILEAIQSKKNNINVSYNCTKTLAFLNARINCKTPVKTNQIHLNTTSNIIFGSLSGRC